MEKRKKMYENVNIICLYNYEETLSIHKKSITVSYGSEGPNWEGEFLCLSFQNIFNFEFCKKMFKTFGVFNSQDMETT